MTDSKELFVEELIVGCNYSALSYSEEHGIPMVYVETEPPNFFEEETLQEFTEKCFHLSTVGSIPFGDLPDTLRIHPEMNALSVFCGSKRYDVLYEKLYIFSDKGVIGLPEPKKKNTIFKVLDWLDINSSDPDLETITTDSEFVKNIYFYPSLRSGRKNLKDAVAVSYLNQEQLSDLSYSDSYARLKSVNALKDAGISGTKMGNDRRRPLRVVHSHREVIPLGKNEYDDIPCVKFLND